MQRFIDLQLLFTIQSLAQRFTLDVRHYIVQKSIGRARVEERKYVRMIESRGELDLSQETIRAERCGEIRMKNLECDDAIVLAILREINRRHSASSELAVDRV